MTTVALYRLPFQRNTAIRINGPEALQALGGTPDIIEMNLPNDYLGVGSFERDVPLGDCDHNYAVIDGHGFWFAADTRVSNLSPGMRCSFVRDPWYDYGKSTFKGRFDALPYYSPPYLPFVIGDDDVAPNRYPTVGRPQSIFTLPRLPSFTPKHGTDPVQLLWLEMVVSVSGSLSKYGSFVTYSDEDPLGTQAHDDQMFYWNTANLNRQVLPIDEFLNYTSNLSSAFGFTPADILSMSISERCPYDYDITSQTVSGKPIHTVGVYHYHPGVSGSTSIRQPEERSTSVGYSPVVLINLTGTIGYDDKVMKPAPVRDINIPFDAVEFSAGIQLCDTNGNIIATLPKAAFQNGHFTCRTVSDYDGIRSYIRHNVFGFNIVFKEGYLPYSGTAWSDYARANLAYDREAMQISISQANSDAIINAAGSVASGGIAAAAGGNIAGGAIGAGTTLIGLATSLYGNKISEDNTRALQRAKEETYRKAADTNYNTGYGMVYCFNSAYRGASIITNYPVSLGETAREVYVKTHGYPAVGEKTETLGVGFYQGYLDAFLGSGDMPTYVSKFLMDIMNDEMSGGIRFISAIGDI